MRIIAESLRLGAAGPENVGSKRRELWKWLAQQLRPDDPEIEDISPSRTLYVSSEDIRDDVAVVGEFVASTAVEYCRGDSVDLLILDVLGNDYQMLTETLMFHLVSSVVTLVLNSVATDACILVSAFPPVESSVFWLPFVENRLALAEIGALIHVISGTGDHSVFDPGLESSQVPFRLSQSGRIKRGIKRRQELWSGISVNSVEQKTVRRLGHFKRPSSGPTMCSRYFFDSSLAVDDISSILVGRVRNAISRKKIGQPTAVAVHSPMSPWMEEVALIVATGLGRHVKQVVSIQENLEFKASPTVLAGEPTLLLTDLVFTGKSAQNAVDTLMAANAFVLPSIYSAMTGGLVHAITWNGTRYSIDSLIRVQPNVSPQASCRQCNLGLPFTSIRREEYFAVPAYDFWEMADECDWIEERDTPSGSVKFQKTLDVKGIFDKYGDWLSLKIADRIRYLGFGDDVVIVCPDEIGSTTILGKLRVRFQNRMTAVTLPRTAIDRSFAILSGVEAGPGRNGLLQNDETWAHQLRHLARRRSSVVLLDEFNASGRTARSMSHLMRLFDVDVRAYLVGLDRAPGSLSELGFPIFSLYEFSSPRLEVLTH